MIALPRLAARIFGEPLAIERTKLDVLVSAITARLMGAKQTAANAIDDDDDDDDDEALSNQPDAASAPAGIAVIDISGTLVAKSTGMDALCGLTSYPTIAAQFAAAMADPSVAGVLLTIDSPGGEVQGMFELADQMFAARGTKPVVASVDCAASAAYMLASSADKIVVSQTGTTGSIGIIALHRDQSAADAQAGLKYTAIYAGDRKNDGNPHEPLSPEAKNALQERMNKIYGMFTDAVARNRGIAPKAVRGTQASQYTGSDGVDAGLADQVGTQDDAIALLSAAIQASIAASNGTGAKSFPAASAAFRSESSMDKTAVTQPVIDPAAAADALAGARNEGFSAAAEIVELCAIAGSPERAAGFISARKSVTDVRASLLADKVKASGPDLNTSVMPGADAKAEANAPQGKPKPWSELLASMGFANKEKR